MGFLNSKNILIFIILFTSLTRLYHLDYPKAYVFDEVYHAFTAKEYLKANKNAWDPFATPPKGVAFEWTHPPLAKEIMTASMFIFRTQDAWAWRLPGTLLGILSVCLVYLLAIEIFKNQKIALMSSFLFSIDGLNFVQSRTGMNDIYSVTFVLVSLLFFLRRNMFISAVFLGLALSSKWASIYLLILYTILLAKDFYFKKNKLVEIIHTSLHFLFIPVIIYLASYIPFFIQKHSFGTFLQLQQQMWWYHTHLKATHDYASSWWSWPLNLYPVWYFVDYSGDKIANIFASENPLMFYAGALVIILTGWEFVKKKSFSLLVILLGYFAFWLPWAFSPRIMFLYHYSLSVPFLSLTLGYQLNKLTTSPNNRKMLFVILGLIFLSFVLLYPFLTGMFLPKDWVKFFFLTNFAKNPFL